MLVGKSDVPHESGRLPLARVHHGRERETTSDAAAETSHGHDNRSSVGRRTATDADEDGTSTDEPSSAACAIRPPVPPAPPINRPRPFGLLAGLWSLSVAVQLNQKWPIDLGSSCSTRIRRSLNFQKSRFLKKYVAPAHKKTTIKMAPKKWRNGTLF